MNKCWNNSEVHLREKLSPYSDCKKDSLLISPLIDEGERIAERVDQIKDNHFVSQNAKKNHMLTCMWRDSVKTKDNPQMMAVLKVVVELYLALKWCKTSQYGIS